VNKGVIEGCKIYGDFFGVGDVSEIENVLKNTRYEKNELERVLADVDTTYYFGKVSKEEFLQLIY